MISVRMDLISVDEELPESTTAVLVRCGFQECHMAFYENGQWFRLDMTPLASVTHWTAAAFWIENALSNEKYKP